MTVRLTRTIEIARIAKTAGFDMLYIDLEHSPLTMDATGQICMAALDAGICPRARAGQHAGIHLAGVGRRRTRHHRAARAFRRRG